MGLELAKAFISVRGDSSRLTGDFNKMKAKATSAFRGIATVATGILAGIGVAGGVAGFISLVRSGETFNQKMRQSLAIMGDVSSALRDDMRQAAFAAARATRFSAAQAAESFFFLASAGLDAAQSIAAMPQVAQFAQAGNFDLARATDLATDAQSALGLTVKDSGKNLQNLTRVTDVLVKANTLANASVEQFSLAITNKAGAASRTAGKDIEELTATLAALADQGIKSSEAGNAINIVLRELQTKSIQNRSTFNKFGVEVFDASGKMKNMADIVENLEDALTGMEAEQKKATLAQLGFADKSVIFIQTLLGTSEKIRGYEKALRDAGGTTKEVADKQLTPLQKGTAKLGAAFTKAASDLMRLIGPVIGRRMTRMARMLDIIGDTISKNAAKFRRAFTLMKESLSLIGSAIFEAGKNLFDAFGANLDNLPKTFSGIITFLIDEFAVFVLQASRWFNVLVKNSDKTWELIKASAQLAFLTMVDVIRHSVESGIKLLKALGEFALGAAGTFATNFPTLFRAGLTTAFVGFIKFQDLVTNVFIAIIDNFGKSMKSMANVAKVGVKLIALTFFDLPRLIAESIAGAITDVSAESVDSAVAESKKALGLFSQEELEKELSGIGGAMQRSFEKAGGSEATRRIGRDLSDSAKKAFGDMDLPNLLAPSDATREAQKRVASIVDELRKLLPEGEKQREAIKAVRAAAGGGVGAAGVVGAAGGPQGADGELLFKRIGFAEFGKSIQDAVLGKENPVEKAVKEAQKTNDDGLDKLDKNMTRMNVLGLV